MFMSLNDVLQGICIHKLLELPAKGLGPLRLERRILPCLMGTDISMNTAHPPLMG